MCADESQSPDAARPVSRTTLLGGGLAVFAGTFLFRYITVDFPNDHFVHLSRARQIVLGEVPIRDFFDPGLILQYYVSAAALIAFGDTLLGEAVLTISFIALGTALSFTLALRASRSVGIALVAAITAAATMPRLYSYPKAFLYVLALACGWRYARAPGGRGLIVLALVTAAAFLFRPDHGVYIAVAVVVLLALAHWRDMRSTAAAMSKYGAMTAVLLLPLLVFLAMTAGVTRYYLASDAQAQDITTPRLLRLPLTIDRSAPLVAVDPAPGRQIRVRWTPDVRESERQNRETRYHLANGSQEEGLTWRYVLNDDSRANIRALISDRAVADTHGIDRERAELSVRESWRDSVRRLGTLRINVGIFTPQNALAWLYYVTIGLPLAGVLILVASWRQGRFAPADRAALGMTVVLCLVINQGLVRDNPRVRLPDVATATVVLGAWVAAVLVGNRASRTRLAALTAVGALTIWSAGTVGGAGERLRASGVLTAPGRVPEQIADVTAELRRHPIEVWAPEGSTGIRALTRYIHDCTRPDDRVLVTWFEPGVFFYAQRRFAGGQVYLDPGWHDSTDDQRLTIERMKTQRVPIVLVRAEVERIYQQTFGLVHDYVRLRYWTAARSTFGGDQEYAVLVDMSLAPSGRYEPLDLPCYR
jgi:hypothetical protein